MRVLKMRKTTTTNRTLVMQQAILGLTFNEDEDEEKYTGWTDFD